MSHWSVNSGRVDVGNRLVIGMAPIAMALMRDTHPVSVKREMEVEWGGGGGHSLADCLGHLA